LSQSNHLNAHTLHISLYDLAFLGTIFIGLTFTALLWFTKRINRTANRFLSLALLTIVLQMARVLGFDINLATYFPRWNWLPLQFSLALGPLIFFYVRKITRPEYKLRWKDMLHFSPLPLELGAQALAIRDSIKTGAATYQTPVFQQLNPVLQVVTFVSVIIYLYLAHRLIERFYRSIKFNWGDRYRYELRWLHRLLVGFGLLWLLWIPFTVVNYSHYHNQLNLRAYYPLYLLLAVGAIWMAATAFLRPEVGLLAAPAPSLKPPLPAEMKQMGIWLKKTMQAGRYYQDPELSLVSLAEKLGLTTHELSRIINVALKKNFNDFINEYRVAEVARKMLDPDYDNITLLGIAYASGFNSKSTFNLIFKKVTGKTPAEYKIDLKKEFLSYNLGRQPRFAAVISNHETTLKWSHKKLNRNIMFKNYLKIAWRNLVHNKSYTFINITGLTIGIAASLLIFLVIRFETSFENFHKNTERIYRVVGATKTADGIHYHKGTAFPIAQGLHLDYPQLEHVARIYMQADNQITVINGNSGSYQKKFKEKNLFFADPEFFNIFNFPFVAGDPKTALSEPNEVVFTQEEANKYFGDWHTAVGKLIKYNNDKICKVTGILKDVPANTDLPLQVVFSFKTSENDASTDWVSQNGDLNTFVVLPKYTAAEQFDNDLVHFVKRHTPAQYRNQNYILQPLNDIHYNGEFGNYNAVTFSKQLINTLSIIGLVLLVIACVNFINLATAQAVNRSKEVGVRKVLGSTKGQLIFQFLTETSIITSVAVIIAIAIASSLLPLLDNLLQVPVHFNFNLPMVMFLVSVITIVTLLSGFYPAMVISGFKPITALRSKFTNKAAGGLSLRRALVVLQFTIAQTLIIGTLVIVGQMNFFRNAALGFDKTAIITVPIPTDSLSLLKISALKNQLLQVPGIKDVSFSTFRPVDNSHWGSDFNFDNSRKLVAFNADLKWADADYFKTYNIYFVAGGPYLQSDSLKGFVVNEMMANKLGFSNPKDILGKKINFWGGQLTGPVVGVVKDFHGNSLAKEITPTVLGSLKWAYQLINIKIKPENTKQTLASIASLWNNTYPNYVYEYQFLDEKIANLYQQQDQLAQLYKIFAAIAIFISCLGLYGLVSFMAVQRIREIGIRKVLGASVSSILYLFSKEFTLLIGFAFILATPIAYYFMHSWLQNFAYRINIDVSIFLLTIIISLAVAWLTVSYQAIRAALANPTKSLRSE